MTYILAGSLGAVGMMPSEELEPPIEETDTDELNPSDAEALGDHIISAFEQARATMQ